MDTATLTRRPAPAGAAPRRGTARSLTLGAIGAAVAVWLAGYAGFWQLTIVVGVVGVVIGLVARGRAVPLVAVLAGAAGWGVPLAVLATQADVAHLAGVVADLAGLGSGPAVIAATVAVGALLTASGAWVGSATRSTIRSRGKHDV